MTLNIGFFHIAILIGMTFTGLIAIIAALRRDLLVDAAERAGVRLSLAFALSASFFGFLPLALLDIGLPDRVNLRIDSLLMALFLAYQILVALVYARVYRMRFRYTMIFLLVVSAFFVTIELLNSLWWSSLEPYVLGLSWLMLLAGVQFAAYASYDNYRQNHPAIVLRRFRERLWGIRPTGYTHVKTNRYRDNNRHRFPHV